MLHDTYHRVRADAIRTLVFAISSVKNINQENADLFSEYLFPTLVKKKKEILIIYFLSFSSQHHGFKMIVMFDQILRNIYPYLQNIHYGNTYCSIRN
jgi:hypothetical protein